MMLFPIICGTGMQSTEDQIKGYSESLQNWWHQWELRGLVIISILAQFILTTYGSRRKFKFYRFRDSFFMKQLVWCAYLISDWVAGFALGVISNNLGNYSCICKQQEDANPQLMALWATLFLMHLGGPDNITAYALEDNELWSRHLVGLVAQTSVTAYIIVLSWDSHSPFSRLSILMLIVGFIKYWEKIWSLYSASIKHRRSSNIQTDFDENLGGNESSDPKTMLRRFKFLFISFFTDVVLSTRHIERDRLHFQEIGFEEAFRVVKIELGLAYDVFYTKALVRYTFWGFISPLITFTGTTILYGYCRLYIANVPNITLPDIIFTYLLSIVALLSEAKSVLYLALSSFTSHRLGARAPRLGMMLIRLRPRGFRRETQQTSLFPQYHFLALCKKNKSPVSFGKLDISYDFHNANRCEESPELMKMIFNNLRDKSVRCTSSNKPNFRTHILEYDRLLEWASKLEFQRSIILWHIATDICYYSDPDVNRDDEDEDEDEEYARYSKENKNLSDYMFYLLLECRYMLPVGSGLVTLHDTCVEEIQFLRTKNMLEEANVGEAYQRLLQFENPAEVGSDQSLLFGARRLAEDLMARDRKEMWMFLAELWIEILGYVAANCRGDNHAQQLRRGGEFLSQVWLLQAHFGLLEQFRVTETCGPPLLEDAV